MNRLNCIMAAAAFLAALSANAQVKEDFVPSPNNRPKSVYSSSPGWQVMMLIRRLSAAFTVKENNTRQKRQQYLSIASLQIPPFRQSLLYLCIVLILIFF